MVKNGNLIDGYFYSETASKLQKEQKKNVTLTHLDRKGEGAHVHVEDLQSRSLLPVVF